MLTENYVSQEFNLHEETGENYWHCNFFHNDNLISAGFAKNRETAKAIAWMELNERLLFKKIKKDRHLSKKWGINLLDTGCGFAAGTNLRNTILRSIGEACERWTVSKWIDENYYLEEIKKSEINLSPTANWICNQFDNVRFFEHKTKILFNQEILDCKIVVTVGFINGGAYPGMSNNLRNFESYHEHSLIESFRHLLLVKNTKPTGCFPDNKVRFFSKNVDLAIKQIDSPKTNAWSIPKLIFHNHEYIENQKIYLSRTIFDGWKPWNLDINERFLY